MPKIISLNITQYIVAIAVPIDTPRKNIYLAFNFEANYGLPFFDTSSSANVETISDKLKYVENAHQKREIPEMPFSRKRFYQALETQLYKYILT